MKKELYDKCRNPLKQALCALDAETQIVLSAARGNCLECLNRWGTQWDPADEIRDNGVYRISDKAAPPPEPQWVDVPAEQTSGYASGPRYWYAELSGARIFLSQIHVYCDFEGITYDSGFVPLQPYNPEHGTPVSVRFKKETK